MGLVAQMVEVERVGVEQFNDVGTLLAQVVSLEAELRKTRELLHDASEALEFYAEGANVVGGVGEGEVPLLVAGGYKSQSDGCTYIEGGQYAQTIFKRVEKFFQNT